MKLRQPFPKDFLWGASTASHQVEGNTTNQWSVWELANAAELAKNAEKKYGELPNWPEIKARAETPENYVSGTAVEHYERYKEDFDLLETMNLNAFRFGIEWSRIEPEEGVWDEAEVRHYHDYIDELNRRGIEPVLNIWHWTMPVWFTDKGGFANKKNLPAFDRFVEKIGAEYGTKLQYVIILNEPNVYASLSYMTGDWPPQEKSFTTALRVYRNLVKAHRRGQVILKAHNPNLQIGVALALSNMQADRPNNLGDQMVTKIMRYGWNWWFLNRINKYQDFVGINYYVTDYYRAFSRYRVSNKPLPEHEARVEGAVPLIQRENPSVPLNDMGWYMEPEGLYPLMLHAWERYRKPIIITENGVADESDEYRQWWLQESTVAMQRALSRGVEIKGYMHWSLLDNFEWAYGWWPKFGLVEVDREHGMTRTIRPSARWFGEQVAELRGIKTQPAPRSKQATDKPRPQAAAPKTPATKPQSQTTKAGIAARYKVRRHTHDIQ